MRLNLLAMACNRAAGRAFVYFAQAGFEWRPARLHPGVSFLFGAAAKLL